LHFYDTFHLLAGNTYLPFAVRSPASRDPQFHDPFRRNSRLDRGKNESNAQYQTQDKQRFSLHSVPPCCNKININNDFRQVQQIL
jgi:hypothetical protein